jgi:aminopeptidase
VEDTRLQAYADLVVRVGAALEPGREVFLRAEVEHAPVARAVADAAYRAGASRVTVEYADAYVRRSALLHGPEESLRTVPSWVMARLEEFAANGTSFVTLTGNPEPSLLEGVDPGRLTAAPLEFVHRSRELMLGGVVPWTIVAAPNPGWATQVFGEPDLDALWDAVAIAMRLDDGTPEQVVERWQEHRRRLAARAAAVTALGLDAVRYHGAGTDLTIGLRPGRIWTGGSLTTNDGRSFMPNLPTEEVFTSPDRNRADGVLRISQPLVMPRAGVLAEGLVVTFERGRIVDVAGERGVDAVRAELETDEGARSLGEVAIVDGGSAVRAAGVTFHDTLYDENAGSHVAWGQSFPFTVTGGLDLTPDQLLEHGLNVSAVHTDVVVGAPGVSVDGVLADGTVVPLVTDDLWVLPV